MKNQTRFIKSITRTATELSQDKSLAMPWERGARRAAFIAKRGLAPTQLKRA